MLIRLLILIHYITRLCLCLIRIIMIVIFMSYSVCLLPRLLRRLLRRRARLLLWPLLILVFFGPSIPYDSSLHSVRLPLGLGAHRTSTNSAGWVYRRNRLVSPLPTPQQG